MAIDTIVLNYPTFFPIILLVFGTLYFNYKLIRNYSHFHWNLFMVAVGLLAISFLMWLLTFFYTHDIITITVRGVTALSAVLFAVTAYIATKSDKK